MSHALDEERFELSYSFNFDISFLNNVIFTRINCKCDTSINYLTRLFVTKRSREQPQNRKNKPLTAQKQESAAFLVTYISINWSNFNIPSDQKIHEISS